MKAFELWVPKSEGQQILWPSTVRLSDDYFDSLTRHAVPLNHMAVSALSGSAFALDVYAWLAQRLHRIPPSKPQTIRWEALKDQFGPEYAELRMFRRKFIETLRHVLTVYPGAKVNVAENGLELCHSAPPVRKRLFAVGKLGPIIIEGKATTV